MTLACHHSVRICVVTYRRPALLERALRSLIAQTRPDWIAEVLNDDPSDSRPAELIAQIADSRISLALPLCHRGAAANFNQAFQHDPAPYAALLEDDNWWEPEFLETLIAALEQRPRIQIACSNERIWREQHDGTWQNTGRTIWPIASQSVEFPFRWTDKCGSARICNSAILFRTHLANAWRTPDDLPVDVTEHFRERVLPHPILLIPRPLVNYAETIQTHRAVGHGIWSEFQVILIGSVFETIQSTRRQSLAAELWADVRRHRPQTATSLLYASLAIPSARSLLYSARPAELFRFLLTIIRRPLIALQILRAPNRRASAWRFLCEASVPSETGHPKPQT